MKNPSQHKRVIISGGGTGGHVFPAIAIGQALKKRDPRIEILFVGARGKMEMEKVPAAGFSIVGLPVRGLQRKISPGIVVFVWKLLRSMQMAEKLIRDFCPDAVVGVGGYASGPVLKVAGRKGIPILIQEQNSFAGITNRWVAKKAAVICVAYEGMEKYFPAEKIIRTGNPVRENLEDTEHKREKGYEFFHLTRDTPVILVLGGSLGARTINESLWNNIRLVTESRVQFIWQTGSLYYREAVERMSGHIQDNLRIHEFIGPMDLAYAAADLVISRAGAGTISELCLVAKPAILVPSPNVAEDHQTKNARSLADREAALLVTDREAHQSLIPEALKLVKDKSKMEQMTQNIRKMAVRDSAGKIAGEVIRLMNMN